MFIAVTIPYSDDPLQQDTGNQHALQKNSPG